MTRRIWVPLGVVLGVLALGALGLWALWRATVPEIKSRIILEAKARGFELDMDDYAVSSDQVVLQNATIRPIGVRGLAARAETVTLGISGLSWRTFFQGWGFGGSDEVTLTALDVDGADVHVLGSAPALALELSRWSEQFPAAYDLPVRAQRVALGWRATSENDPWLLVAHGEVTRHAHGGTFQAADASVLGQRLGAVGSSWSKRDGRIVMGFGQVDPARAPVHLAILLDEPEPLARIELRPTPLPALTGALGITLPLDAARQLNTQVAAKAEFKLPPSLAPTPIPGALHVALIGFVPPHPPELQGFAFGDRTTFDTKFEVSADQSMLTLTETTVSAGAFKLGGQGAVQRTGDHATVHLDLQGALPCVAIAGAAADSRLGKHWAGLSRQLLQTYMQGSVQVKIQLLADTRDLGSARVLQNIGVGCGLKPLRPPTPEELAAFTKQLPGLIAELPASISKGQRMELPKLPTELPALPRALPTLPSALPTLPGRPRAPGSDDDPEPPAQDATPPSPPQD